MISYLSYPDDFSTSTGLTCCWSKDTRGSARSSKYSASVEVPVAGYMPVENPNYNQGFAMRKGFIFSFQIYLVVSSFTFHLAKFLASMNIKR